MTRERFPLYMSHGGNSGGIGDDMLARWRTRNPNQAGERPTVNGRPPRLPDGCRVYAIGDVHGRSDLLRRIETLILEDLDRPPVPLAPLVVYLGDYVDRGFHSRETLEELCANPRLGGLRRVLLMGNHDLWLLDFLKGGPLSASWLQYGGDATLLSYGVQLRYDLAEQDRLEAAREQLRARIPKEHVDLLAGLELAFGLGDYFFCHAGVRPKVPLSEQRAEDLLWMREPFLSWSGEMEKVVVHGHTVAEAPVVRRHRIGIDTGACYTGTLTCLVLEGEERRFLTASAG